MDALPAVECIRKSTHRPLDAAFIAGKQMVSKKQVPPNYDYTGKDRVERQRKALADAGGGRVEAHLDADELAKLDALVATGVAGSRRAALKYLVQQLPEPEEKA